MKLNSTIEKFFFYKIPGILFSLIPFFLITGPFLSDLSISLISIIFLTYCFKNKNFSYFKNKYFYFFLFFWIYLCFNSLINNFNLDSIKISFFYIRYGIFVIAIITFLDFEDKFVKYFLYCIFFCFIVLIIDGFYQYLIGENILGFKTPNPERVSSFFNEEMILGSYLSRLWPIFFGLSLVLFKKKKIFFILFISIFISSELLVFLSGERAAFFYINLSAIFVIIFSKNLAKLRLFTVISSLFLILILSLINPTAKERVIDKTITQMNLLKDNKKNNEKIIIFSNEHQNIYISAYKMFLDNKILGVGVKNFRNFCKEERYFVNEKKVCFTHPHNFYIQLLTETGVIGFFFIMVALIYFCKHIFKHLLMKLKTKKYFTDFEICVLSGILIYLWPFIPTGNIFNNWLNIISILNLPFLIWSRKFFKI